MAYPPKLAEIVEFFEGLPEEEKRENLILYAESVKFHEPREGETFVLHDVRRDTECTDTVGIFLNIRSDETVQFRATLGPDVQTLTRAMTSILCKGFEGLKPEEVLAVSPDFVSRIIGDNLMRARSQTVYYVLGRMKGICRIYLDGGSVRLKRDR